MSNAIRAATLNRCARVSMAITVLARARNKPVNPARAVLVCAESQSASARRQASREGVIDALADLLGELKRPCIIRPLGLGENFPCLFLRA
jgi:hypothetical protein